MKRSITFVFAVAAALALTACGTSINAQTADTKPSVPGINVSMSGVSVRNAMIAYSGIEGYKAGTVAPILVWLFNDTTNEVTVSFGSPAGNVATSAPVTIMPNSFANPDVKLTLSRDIHPNESVPVGIAFVGVHEFGLMLPFAPPDAPAEPHTIELEGEGH